MYYPFECPVCKHKEEISMKMVDYTDKGHICPECNTEMIRPLESFNCGYQMFANGFYGKGK